MDTRSFVRLIVLVMALSSLMPLRSQGQEPVTTERPQPTAEEPTESVFSGPQPGEPLPDFRVRHVTGPAEGEDFDLLKTLQGEDSASAVMLVFVHEVTRPSIAVTRLVVDYARHPKHPSPIHVAVVFLDENPVESINFVRRAKHALPTNVTLAGSIDGPEGPGTYGLNRKVTLTILLATKGNVTANFALIQPSLSVDGPKIGAAIEQVMGSQIEPTLADMGFEDRRRMSATSTTASGDDDTFRSMLAPVIRRDATPAEVQQAVERVEARMQTDAAFATRVRQTATRIIAAGRLEQYGTQAAQDQLKRWADAAREVAPATE